MSPSTTPAPDTAHRKATGNLKQWIGAGLGLVVLCLAIWGIRMIAGQVTLAEIIADIHSTPGRRYRRRHPISC